MKSKPLIGRLLFPLLGFLLLLPFSWLAAPAPAQATPPAAHRAMPCLQQRGGRKRVMAPDGKSLTPQPEIDNALVKALARAHRWQRMLDTGQYASLTELAEAENINRSYLSRMLRLTLLAPYIVEAIMEGRQGPEIRLECLMQPMPVAWEGQERRFRY